MAYFVLTLLESTSGSRADAAKSFHIDLAVLRTIGQLSSTKGGPSTARKAGGQFEELTGAEKQWLETAIVLVIRRIGEHASGATLNRLSMDGLPKI